MRQLISSLTCFGLVAAAGCAGKAPPGQSGDDQMEVDAGDDAPPAEVGHKLSGKTMDYFTAGTPMENSSIASDGVTPPMMVTSATGGLYEIADVPTGSKIFFTVTHALYRPTRNTPVTVADMDVMSDLYMVTIADVNRQYATVNTPVGAGKAVVFADLQRNNGMPLEGIAPTDIVLLDAQSAPVTIAGTYFFGATGDIADNTTLATATAYGGRSRVALLDVPPGSYTLQVTYPNGQGGSATQLTPITTVADGATLALSGGMGNGGGGGGTQITNPKFTTDIYPKLQKAAAGGLGCANCHTAGGPAAILQYDLPAATVLDNIKLAPGVLDLTTPANSLFLTKPLYEPAPYNHPNATFIDINDPDYKLFLLWITQGALL